MPWLRVIPLRRANRTRSSSMPLQQLQMIGTDLRKRCLLLQRSLSLHKMARPLSHLLERMSGIRQKELLSRRWSKAQMLSFVIAAHSIILAMLVQQICWNVLVNNSWTIHRQSETVQGSSLSRNGLAVTEWMMPRLAELNWHLRSQRWPRHSIKTNTAHIKCSLVDHTSLWDLRRVRVLILVQKHKMLMIACKQAW